MNLPDLHDLEIAGVHALHGDPHALAAAAAAAKQRFHSADLAGVGSKAALLAALSKGLKRRAFGSSWDALADSWRMANGSASTAA
jgi:hypothetical protein